MAYKSGKFELVRFYSSIKHLSGQKERCSHNYDMTQLVDAPRMRWEFSDVVSFDVKEDESGTDKYLARGVTSGTITHFFAKSKVYIANVNTGNDNKSGDFLIEVIPTFDFQK